jgi:hypothetical protein
MRVDMAAPPEIRAAILFARMAHGIRNPKHEIRNKIEYRNPKYKTNRMAAERFELRASEWFRIASFGFRI